MTASPPPGAGAAQHAGPTRRAATVTVRATSREQLDDIYRALTGHPMVKVVL